MSPEEKADFAERVIEDMRSCMGVPFKHQGRTKDGLDCIGLLLTSLRNKYYEPLVPSRALYEAYRRTPDSPALIAALEGECDKVCNGFDPLLVQALDIILMDREGRGMPKHIATVTHVRYGRWYMIHADKEVVECAIAPHIASQVHSVYRLKVLA